MLGQLLIGCLPFSSASKTFAGKITIENLVYQSSYKIKSAGDFYDLKEVFEETVSCR